MAKSSHKFDIIFKVRGAKQGERDIGKVDGRIKQMGMTARKAAGLLGVAAVGAALVKAGSHAIKTAATFETLRTRLNVMTGSVSKGTKLFEKFNEVAATTPFQLQNVVEAGASLKAFGADAGAMIKPVSDLAAFMGVDVVDAAQAMGRAFAGGAGAADMLRDRGVLNLIKEFKGIEDLSKLTLPEFRQAMEESMRDPTLGIAGATDELAKTFEGQYSNMKDSLDRLAASFGQLLLPAAEKVIKVVSDLAVKTREWLEATGIFEKVAKAVPTSEFEKLEVAISGLKFARMMGLWSEAARVMRENGIEVINMKDGYQKVSDGIEVLEGKMLGLEIAELGVEESQLKLIDLSPVLIKGINQRIERIDVEAEQEKILKKHVLERAQAQQAAMRENIRLAVLSGQSAQQAAASAVRASIMTAVAQQMADVLTKVPWPFNIAVAAAAGATVAGLFDHMVKKLSKLKFAQGGDFVTQGAQMIMVGDNPSGRERVTITPSEKDPSLGLGSNGNITVNINAPLVDDTVVDHIIPAIRRATQLGIA
jgi:hypothetical protein